MQTDFLSFSDPEKGKPEQSLKMISHLKKREAEVKCIPGRVTQLTKNMGIGMHMAYGVGQQISDD